MGCVFIGPSSNAYSLSNPALQPLKKNISACKNAEKYAISALIF